MKVVLAQVPQAELPEYGRSFWGKTFADLMGALNFKKFVEYLKLAFKFGDLIIFPELYPAGESIHPYNTWIVETAIALAKKFKKHVIIGEFYKGKDNKPRNASVLIYPDGKVSRYFKRNLMFDEFKWGFEKGEPKINEVHGIKIGRLICSDVNSDLVSEYVRLGADIITYQAMAAKFFLKGNNRRLFDEIFKNNPEAEKYYEKTFPKNRRTSWDNLLKKDSKKIPILFVNIGNVITWGGAEEMGGGYSGVYYRGKRIFGLDEDVIGFLVFSINKGKEIVLEYEREILFEKEI